MKIAILGSYSTQILAIELKSLSDKFDIYESDFNQIDNEIFNENSKLYLFSPDLVIIHESSISFKKQYFNQKVVNPKYYQASIQRIEAIVERLSDLIQNVKIIYPTIDETREMTFGNYYYKIPESIDSQINSYNFYLNEKLKSKRNFFLLDINNLINQSKNFRDERLVANAELHFSIDFIKKIAQSLVKMIEAMNGKFIKCIILDLDNTIWGGVIGDDGVESIKIGGAGIGQAYLDFQLWLKLLKKRGVVLCVCSKNDEQTAKEPFIKHPEMVLKLEDFAVFVANWDNKVNNIRYIQSIINIGFDSIVFIDDNPFERDLVKSNIDDIIVPEMPNDPSYYKKSLITQNLFEVSDFSSLDEDRTEKYQIEAKRKRLEENSFNMNDYLKSLNMQATIENFSKKIIPRISQLINRSNQFNARTKRYSETMIDKISLDSRYITFGVSLGDKCGSHGIVSCVILEIIDSDCVFLDTFIMSCRVFNRGLEYFIINYIKSFLLNENFKFITSEWLSSGKNSLIGEFYDKIGFKSLKNSKVKIDIKSLIPTDNYIKYKKGEFYG